MSFVEQMFLNAECTCMQAVKEHLAPMPPSEEAGSPTLQLLTA